MLPVLECLLVLLCVSAYLIQGSEVVCTMEDLETDPSAQVLSAEEAMQILDVADRSLLSEDGCAVTISGGECVLLQSGALRLKPGVYRAEISYRAEAEQVLDLTSESAGYRQLLATAVSVRPQNTVTRSDIYVMQTVSDAVLSVKYTGSGVFTVTRLTLIHTHQEYLMLAILLALLFVVLDLGIWYCRETRAGRFTKATHRTMLALLGIALVINLPHLVNYTQLTDDIRFHLNRISGLAEAWRAGQFPARMQPTWLEGMGYPVSIMYGDIFLWPVALLHLAGFDVALCYKIYIVLINLLTEVIAFASFRAIWKKRSVALTATCSYLFAQYRIYNIYMRGAMGEYTAMTFLPLALAGLVMLLRQAQTNAEYRRGRFMLSAGFAGVFLCHMISTEMALGFAVVVCLIYWKRTFRRQTILAILQAAGAAILAVLWYMVPMLTYMSSGTLHVMEVYQPIQVLGLLPAQLLGLFYWPGGSPYAYYVGMQNVRPYGIGMGLLLAFAIIVWGICRGALRKLDHDSRKEWLVAVGIFVFSAVLTLSLFPWDALSNLSSVTERVAMSIQFPYRFLTITTLTGSYLVGMLVNEAVGHDVPVHFGPAVISRSRILTLLLAGTAVISGLLLTEEIVASKYAINLYSIETIGTQAISGAEYLYEDTYQAGVEYLTRGVSDGLILDSYEKKDLTVTASVTNPTDEDGTLDTGVLYYPGYRAVTSDGTELAQTSGEHGDLLVVIPAGFDGTVTVTFEGFLLWHVADWISGIFVLLLIAGRIRKAVQFRVRA